MEIKCVVACINASGEPDVFPLFVTCTREEMEDGKHYAAAEDEAAAHGYEPRLVFDEQDTGFKYFTDMDWPNVETIVGL